MPTQRVVFGSPFILPYKGGTLGSLRGISLAQAFPKTRSDLFLTLNHHLYLYHLQYLHMVTLKPSLLEVAILTLQLVVIKIEQIHLLTITSNDNFTHIMCLNKFFIIINYCWMWFFPCVFGSQWVIRSWECTSGSFCNI